MSEPSQFLEIKLRRDNCKVDGDVKLLVEIKLNNKLDGASWMEISIPSD